jgi:hypothetical protein
VARFHQWADEVQSESQDYEISPDARAALRKRRAETMFGKAAGTENPIKTKSKPPGTDRTNNATVPPQNNQRKRPAQSNPFAAAVGAKSKKPSLLRCNDRKSKKFYFTTPLCEHDHDPTGNRTPMNMSRGKRNEITRLKETRCFVPYDGYCGYHCLSKIFQVPVENILERLLQWSRHDNPDGFNANQCGQVEFDRKEMQSKMLEIIPRRANNEKDVCCLDAHWCSGSDITVIAKLMGKR